MQDVILHGKADGWPDQGRYDDLKRGQLLCEWGKQFGIEGFVREEAGFEVIFVNSLAFKPALSLAVSMVRLPGWSSPRELR
jgi:hypothetical protein